MLVSNIFVLHTAIAWSPHHHGLLASGGGTADRCIRFWNTLTGQPMQCIDTGSQVCNLAWSKHSSELVSTVYFVRYEMKIWPATKNFSFFFEMKFFFNLLWHLKGTFFRIFLCVVITVILKLGNFSLFSVQQF